MIGALCPLTIRCKPRWKGAIIPVPHQLPFRENADQLALIERVARFAKGLQDHLRAPAAHDGDRLHRAKHQPMIVLSK